MINQIEPYINEEELIQLKRVVESTFVTEHHLTKEFEAFFADYTGSRHAISYSNGTNALFGILKSLGIGPGDEVIVPNLTFVATANSVIMAGAKPVFCDISGIDFKLDLEKVKKVVTSKTKAVIAVHLYGLADDMNSLIKFTKEHNLYLIEDAAQGVGVRIKGKHVGTFGVAGMLSFYGNKTITTGEGGLILTDNDDLAVTCYRIKNHGRDKKGIFKHQYIGFNFSFTEMQAAIGLAQVKKLKSIISRKKEIYDAYHQELSKLPDIRFSPIDEEVSPVFWFTNIFVENAESLSDYLRQKGIQTRRFFYPLNLQPCYGELEKPELDFSKSIDTYKRGLSLPSSYNLTSEGLNYVTNSIKNYFRS